MTNKKGFAVGTSVVLLPESASLLARPEIFEVVDARLCASEYVYTLAPITDTVEGVDRSRSIHVFGDDCREVGQGRP